MKVRKGFTLIEITLVVLISSSIIVVMYRLLETLPRVKNFNDARQTLIQQTNDAMDRFTILFQDYTIDYEEYYNRKAVGCNSAGGEDFSRDVGNSGYCASDTSYGNINGYDLLGHRIQYTGSITPPYSFGEYKQTFWNFGIDTDGLQIPGKPKEVGDADDRDTGMGPEAIGDPANIQELYLISHDGSRRIFLRRFFHEYDEENKQFGSGYYGIQMLKLRGFDAGSLHQFIGGIDTGVFDGQIDTWACDKGQMFVCTGLAISDTLYPGYNLPYDVNDGWVDLFDEKLDILDRNIEIHPSKDPNLARNDETSQINPYIKISLTAGLSNHLASNRNWGGSGGFKYTLENIIDTKGFYIK